MPDHPPKRPKLPSLPPPRPIVPRDAPTPRLPPTRGSGSSEVPPPIVLSDSPTPPLGVPKVTAFESRTIDAWRAYLPSIDQWKVASASVLAAALVGFAVGRSSVPTVARTTSPNNAACPDTTNHTTAAVEPTTARDGVQAAESHVTVPLPPVESAAPSPPTIAAPDPAAQEATDKAIARAMSRGARRAASCRGPSSSSGTAHVTVTFLPTGEVKTATVRGAPFAGTADGECIVGKFRPLRVPPFSGDNVTVRKDFALE